MRGSELELEKVIDFTNNMGIEIVNEENIEFEEIIQSKKSIN